MIISKTPFRMSFVGGGSDMPEFYGENEGAVLSTSIDKYMYIAIHKKFDGQIRLSYSQTEEVLHASQIKHPIVKETLKLMGVSGGLEISSMADIPSAGTGLGSSSSYTVGLLNALNAFRNQYVSKEYLAKTACEIEILKCGDRIGKQDQYAAAYGGLNLIKFLTDGSVVVEPVIVPPAVKMHLENSLLMFYTGVSRKASTILNEQSNNITNSKSVSTLRAMVSLVHVMKKELEAGKLDHFGSILHENWLLKKDLAVGVSNDFIDAAYEAAINAGALGGKLMGAGSGGFLLFYAPKYAHKKISQALSPMRRVRFNFESAGSQIIFFQPEDEEAFDD